jgi:hypothetical protein
VMAKRVDVFTGLEPDAGIEDAEAAK